MDKETRVEATGKNTPKVYMKKNVKLVEWKNSNEDGSRYFLNFNIRKVYKDGEEWKESDGFSLQELESVKYLIEDYLRHKYPIKAL